MVNTGEIFAMRKILLLTLLTIAAAVPLAAAQGAAPVDIGSRLEPFFDTFLIDSLDGAVHRLHHPRPGEAVLRFDKPWEGRFSGYTTVFKDGRTYRMYYRGMPRAGSDGTDVETTCCALSVDGVHWEKPELGLYKVHGTWKNNVVLAGNAPYSHNFAPFVDANPGAPADQRYKALSGIGRTGLVAWVSADGVQWSKVREEPVLTEGAFDSHNVAFWSVTEECYVCYFRIFEKGIRGVARAISPDFVNWSEATPMTWGGTPREHIYTNETLPYYRAPHIYVSVAARFMPGRRVVTQEQMTQMGGNASYSGDCSDAVFFTTRGGSEYNRTFMEGFVRPGLGYENWTSRTNYPAYGIVPVSDTHLSFYINRNYGQDSAYLQRMILRVDGFASIHAPYEGGQMTTKPFVFDGGELVINFSTSAAGSVWVEVLDQAGKPIEGFTQADADEIIGDEIARKVTWNGAGGVSALAGKPVRLRCIMKDANLYALRFR